MKNILSRFGKISLLLAFMYFVVGCDDDKEDVAPGLYVMSDEIETFPGDTVLVSGTASNYVGLESVTLSCEQWGIHKVYELGGQKPKVFNYNYQLIVPKNASFDYYPGRRRSGKQEKCDADLCSGYGESSYANSTTVADSSGFRRSCK